MITAIKNSVQMFEIKGERKKKPELRKSPEYDVEMRSSTSELS